MPGACPQLGPNSAFLTGVLENVDCQARTIGESGYQALAAPGSSVGLILTGLLTLFVALHGYRMILGQTPTPREGVMAVVKIGLVLALATSWATYRTLVYDVTLRAPAELAAEIGRPAGLPGTGGAMTAWLQSADDALLALTVVGPDPQTEAQAATPPQPRPVNPLVRRVDPTADAAMLGYARILFLTGAIGAFASVRLIAGLLLAIGPLFVAFLLFGGTRGLFEGWLRGLVGVALGALGTTIILGVELALLVPWLISLIAERRMGGLLLGAPVEIMVLTLVFALALLATLAAAARVAWGLKLPQGREIAALLGGAAPETRGVPIHRETAANPADEQRSRALVIADAVANTQRRERGADAPSAAYSDRHAPREAVSRDVPAPPPTPLGQTFRRTRNRVSAGATRRDHAA